MALPGIEQMDLENNAREALALIRILLAQEQSHRNSIASQLSQEGVAAKIKMTLRELPEGDRRAFRADVATACAAGGMNVTDYLREA